MAVWPEERLREQLEEWGRLQRRIDELLEEFAIKRLSTSGLARVEARLREVGIALDRSLLGLKPQDEVQLSLGPATGVGRDDDEAWEGGRPREAYTWRLDALLESYGFTDASQAARQAVEEALYRKGLSVDPPLRRAPRHTDVWVYPIRSEPEVASVRAPGVPASQHAARYDAPPGAESSSGLGRWQKRGILLLCTVLALVIAGVILGATGNLGTFVPGSLRATAPNKRAVSLAESFGHAYTRTLASQGQNDLRLEGVRCAQTSKTRFRCEATTRVEGSGSYPANFDVSVGAVCWRARPLAPNLVKTVIKACR